LNIDNKIPPLPTWRYISKFFCYRTGLLFSEHSAETTAFVLKVLWL